MSHAMCVRGLKLIYNVNQFLNFLSHAMCVRGLKPLGFLNFVINTSVARHVRAWIETLKNYLQLL